MDIEPIQKLTDKITEKTVHLFEPKMVREKQERSEKRPSSIWREPDDLTEIVVAHMEVPCCTGILHAVLEARRRSGSDIPINEVIVSTRGHILARRKLDPKPTELSPRLWS